MAVHTVPLTFSPKLGLFSDQKAKSCDMLHSKTLLHTYLLIFKAMKVKQGLLLPWGNFCRLNKQTLSAPYPSRLSSEEINLQSLCWGPFEPCVCVTSRSKASVLQNGSYLGKRALVWTPEHVFPVHLKRLSMFWFCLIIKSPAYHALFKSHDVIVSCVTSQRFINETSQ